MALLGLQDKVNGEAGYSTDLKLTEIELDTFRKMIRMQWLYRLQLLAPKEIQKFDGGGMEQYHQFDYMIDHAKAWPKYSRVLPKDAIAIIKNMPFFKQLEQEFAMVKIADEENLGWENVYWRLVRPGNKDYGTIHADQWFVDLGYYGDEIHDHSLTRLKIWIPIYATPGKNGLLVIPGSHHKTDWKWHAETLSGLKKPVIDEKTADLNAQLLNLEPGRAVVFHYSLLHGGAENLAETTRVSIEFTFLVHNRVN